METSSKEVPAAIQGNGAKKVEQGPLPLDKLNDTENNGVKLLSPQNFSLSSFMTSSLFTSAPTSSNADANSSESIIARLCAEETRMKAQFALAHQRIGEQDALISKQRKDILEAQEEIARLKHSEKVLTAKLAIVGRGFVEESIKGEKVQNTTPFDEMGQFREQVEDQEKAVQERSAPKKLMQADGEDWGRGKKRRKSTQ